MKRFRYRLQTLLKIRIREEERQAQALSQCQRRLTQAREELSRLDARWGELSRDTAKSLVGDMDMPRVEYRLDELNQKRIALAAQRSNIGALEIELNTRRLKYQAAAKARKILERLRDLKREEHRDRVRRLDTAFFDFVGAVASRRRE